MASRKVTDSRTNIYSVESYERAFPYSGKVKKVQTYQQDGTPISEQTTTMNYSLSSSNPGQLTYFVHVDSLVTSRYDIAGPTKGVKISDDVESYQWIGPGMPTHIERGSIDLDPASPTYMQGFGISDITLTYGASSGQNMCLTLPEQRIENGTWVEQYYIDTAMCRVTGMQFQDGTSPQNVFVQYGYDNFGNIASTSVTGREPGQPGPAAARSRG